MRKLYSVTLLGAFALLWRGFVFEIGRETGAGRVKPRPKGNSKDFQHAYQMVSSGDIL